jgi:uncharacterized protein involved in exopolysaccharide biosynthesis
MIEETPISTENNSPRQVGDAHRTTPLTFPALFRILWRGKITLLWGALAGLIVLGIYAFTQPLRYTATATFLPPESTGGLSSTSAMLSQISGFGASSLLGGGKNQTDFCISILKSRAVADTIIDRFHLMELYNVKKRSAAQGMLQGQSLFLPDTKGPFVTITVTDRKPERARDLANAFLDALQETSARLSMTESSKRRSFYEQQLLQEKDALASAEVALKEQEEKSGIVAPTGQTMSHIQSQAQIQAQITEREARLAALLASETEQNPDVLSLRGEISNLRGQLTQLQRGTSLDQASTAQMPALQLEYIRKERDVKFHEALFELLSKQYEAARLDTSRETPLQVLDRATTPDTKSGPRRNLLMAFGVLLGTIAGACWTLVKATKEPR